MSFIKTYKFSIQKNIPFYFIKKIKLKNLTFYNIYKYSQWGGKRTEILIHGQISLSKYLTNSGAILIYNLA